MRMFYEESVTKATRCTNQDKTSCKGSYYVRLTVIALFLIMFSIGCSNTQCKEEVYILRANASFTYYHEPNILLKSNRDRNEITKGEILVAKIIKSNELQVTSSNSTDFSDKHPIQYVMNQYPLTLVISTSNIAYHYIEDELSDNYLTWNDDEIKNCILKGEQAVDDRNNTNDKTHLYIESMINQTYAGVDSDTGYYSIGDQRLRADLFIIDSNSLEYKVGRYALDKDYNWREIELISSNVYNYTIKTGLLRNPQIVIDNGRYTYGLVIDANYNVESITDNVKAYSEETLCTLMAVAVMLLCIIRIVVKKKAEPFVIVILVLLPILYAIGYLTHILGEFKVILLSTATITAAFFAFAIFSSIKENLSTSKSNQDYEESVRRQDDDINYYLLHKDDIDQSSLDKEKMKSGEFYLAFRSVIAHKNSESESNNSSDYETSDHSSLYDNSSDSSSNIGGTYQEDVEDAYKKNFYFVDPSGEYRHWGDDFIDYRGNWCNWGGSFYDKDLNYRNWGDSFIDGKGNWGSLKNGFYDAEGNWIPGYSN